MPSDKKWLNATFLSASKKAVTDCDHVEIKSSYKLSTDYNKKAIITSKPKKKAAPRKKEDLKKKKAASKKKAVSKHWLVQLLFFSFVFQ